MIAMRTRSLAVLMAAAVLAASGGLALLAKAADAHGGPSHRSHVALRKALRPANNHRRGVARTSRTRRHATSTVHPNSIPRPPGAGCAGYECDYQDPVAQGCNTDATPFGEALISDPQGNQLGYVDLMWSPSCQTNWAVVTSTSGPISTGLRYMQVEIKRQSDGAWEALDTDGGGGSGNNQGGGYGNGGPTYVGATSLYTDMLYSPGPAEAQGTIDGITGTYSQTGSQF